MSEPTIGGEGFEARFARTSTSGGGDGSEVSVSGPAIRFGAAYYLEYEPTPHLEHDLDLMAEAGFSVIRVGESVWSTWEPEDGVFDLDWLQPVLDGALARGIGVVLGTPTYAAPMWLTRRYPEIALETATGQRMGWGARQEMDFTHAAFRFHAERIIRAVVGRYRDHPAIIGYQVDNEPGLRLAFNEGVFQGFVDRLRRQYGTVEALNEAWGLVYWSHRLSTWADLWRPDGNVQPQYDLAWRRYQADLVTEFIGWQADIVREVAGTGRFVTTCLSYDQVGIEDVDLSASLDVAAGNAYFTMQDGFTHPSSAPRSSGVTGWVAYGPWAVTQLADLMYSSKQAPFLVTETNAGSIGISSMNESPYDGQWLQAAWLLVSRGARMVEYWHWNTNRSGAETWWGGVLPHSGIPGRAYREIARIGADFAGAAGDAFRDAEPEFDVAVLYDSDSRFALGPQSPFSGTTSWIDPDGYRRIVATFSRGIFDAKRQERIVRPQQILPSRGGELSPADCARRFPVLVAAAFFTAADDDIAFLRAYAREGGHLILGPRSLVADEEGRVHPEQQPAGLAEDAGAWYEELMTLAAPVRVEGGLTGSATDLAEGLIVTTAETLSTYEHPHLGRWAAVTTRSSGAGRITLVGTVPDQELAESLITWAVPEAVAGWAPVGSVTVATSSAADGRGLHVVHNWGWAPTAVPVPIDLTDLRTGERLAVGTPLALGAWDVRILAAAPIQEKDSHA